MSDSVQVNLQVPEIDWNKYDTGGKVQAPPDAKGPDGRYIQYYVQLPADFPETVFGPTREGFLKAKIGPLVFQNNSTAVDGRAIRFQTVSAKPYMKDGQPQNASQMGNFLRSAGAPAPAATVESYKAAVRSTAGKLVPVFIEWEVFDSQTRQTVKKGYDNFDGEMGAKSPIFETADGRRLVANATVKSFLTP